MMTVYLDNSNKSTPQLVSGAMSEFCKISEYKFSIQKSTVFLGTNNDQLEKGFSYTNGK